MQVIVPARNEAAVLDACLFGLRTQHFGRAPGRTLQIVVVDDDSDDSTAAITRDHAARDDRVSLVRSDGPPPGWTGKVHALATGLASARTPAVGEPGDTWVLAVDADVVLAPTAVERLLGTAIAHGLDLISTPGGPPTGRSLSWPLLMPAGLGLIGLYATPDGSGRRALALGHCLLVARSTLDAVGGWAALADRRGEDIALATRVRDHGGRTHLVDGLDDVTTLGMDPLAVGWVSFRKSFVAALDARASVLVAAGVAQILTAGAGPLLILLNAPRPRRNRRRRRAAIGLGATTWAAQALAHASTAALMRSRPGLAPLAPASGIAIALVLIDGARTVLTGTHTWKGRLPGRAAPEPRAP